MPKISGLLKIEHDFEHVFNVKKRYSEPKIFDAKGDLAQRWYIYYSYRNPTTGKLERQDNIYGDFHKYKTLSGRRKAIKQSQHTVLEILQNGFNPYDDMPLESELDQVKKYSTGEAIDFVLKLKKGAISESYYKDLESRLLQFKKWLEENGWKHRFIASVNKEVVVKYLNHVMMLTTPSNRNNTRSNISVFYTALVAQGIISKKDNFISEIHIEKSTPERHQSYTASQEKEIYELIAERYPVFMVFIKFVSYNFLRPIEVCRLQVSNIDVVNMQLHVKAKNKAVKIKIIPKILFDELPDLSKYNRGDSLFNMHEFGGTWETEEINKRNFYSNLFKGIKKEFGLGKNYGMYSFRHTFITKLYREFRKNLTVFEAESKLMMITGHTTHDALKKYLRDIDAELPDDYSDSIKKANLNPKTQEASPILVKKHH